MNKSDLIDAVSKVTCTKKEAEAAVNTFLDAITRALKKKEEVTLIGFGTFAVKKRKARTGRNPQTGEKIRISARKVPVFRPGKALREAIR
jgi:nucleoid DNA-binding protein